MIGQTNRKTNRDYNFIYHEIYVNLSNCKNNIIAMKYAGTVLKSFIVIIKFKN